MNRKSKIKIAVISVVGLLAIFVVDLLRDAGAFKSISSHGSVYREIGGFGGGTEDFAARPNQKSFFVSSPNFRDPSQPGGIYLVDASTFEVKNVTPELPFPLQPHGMDALAVDGKELLFVVNHRNGSALPKVSESAESLHTVEVFDVDEAGNLKHVKSVADPLIISPNDVAALDAESFLVTNDHAYHGVARAFEDYLRLASGNVVLCKTSGCKIVAEDLVYPNGIETQGEQVFVAETTGRTLNVFALRGERLTHTRAIPCGSGIDNLTVDAHGMLWTGAHPKLLDFVAHSKDPAARSPSQVLKIDPISGEVEEVYLNDGDPISGSSAALSMGGRVFVGAVFDRKVVVLD